MSETHKLGEIIRGEEIGRLPDRAKFIWVRCPDCYEERWTQYTRVNHTSLRACKDCSISRAKRAFYVGRGLEHKLTYKKKVE